MINAPNPETTRAVTKMFQEVTDMIGTELQVDVVERLILLEVIALRMKTQLQQGPNISSISRATGLPHETVRRRVKKLSDNGLIIRKIDGLDFKDPERIYAFYDRVCFHVLETITNLGNQSTGRVRAGQVTPAVPSEISRTDTDGGVFTCSR